MKRVIAGILLGLCALTRVASASEDVIVLEPFVVEASREPSLEVNFGGLDTLYNDWYVPIIDQNLIGDFNNWGFTPPAAPPPANPCGGSQAASQFTGPYNPELPTTTVELRYNRISWLGYTHAYLVITSPDGEVKVVRGGPSSQQGGGSGSSSVDPSTSDWDGTVFGTVLAQVQDAPQANDLRGDVVSSTTILQTNAPFSDVMSALTTFVNSVNDAHINYNPLAANSNSVAHEAPQALGLPRQGAHAWAPGTNTHLICP